MGYGTKFRLPTCLSVKQIMQQFTYDLDLFIYKLLVHYNKPLKYFKQWKCLILNCLKLELKNASSLLVSCNKSLLFKNIGYL